MAWLRSAMNRAAEVRGRSSFGDVIRSRTGYISLPGNDVPRDANNLRDRVKARSIKSYKEAIRRLEEVSISSKGEERVQLLRRWLVSLREIERQNAGSAQNDEKHLDKFHTSSDKYNSPGHPDLVLYYDPDLGVSPVNFRDVLLQSHALEGITMSMIVEAPNEEEILLLHELFGLCLTGGKEVHDVIVKRILDLSKAFSVYDDEVLTKRKELLQFGQDAIGGLKLNVDILRIDSEISEIHQKLRKFEHLDLSIESNPSSLDAILEVIKESVSPIRLCCKLESLLLKKKLLNSGDTPQDHAHKVDKLKVLSESLLSSASNSEKRISDHRQQKEAALHFRVAKTSEVTQIEKELGVEIHELEKQRDELEAELNKVKNLLAVAIDRLQTAAEEREQFDDVNNELLVHFKSKEDELSKAILSYRAEADTCCAFVEFLEATWDFQSSFMEQKEKKVNDDLEIHEEYSVNVTRSLLSHYKNALGPAIAILREHMKNLKRYEKAIDPDEEFLQDIEQRNSLEHAYLAAEKKVITIFDAVDSVKGQFYHSFDNVSRKGVEPVHELCESIKEMKSEFESLQRPILRNDKLTQGGKLVSKESPRKGVSPSSKSVLAVDLKSIFTQKLVTITPNKKPYIPLGVSTENSPSNPNDGIKPVERLEHQEEQGREDDNSSTPNKEQTREDKKFLEPSGELGNSASKQEIVKHDASELSTSDNEKSVDPNYEMLKLAPEAININTKKIKH